MMERLTELHNESTLKRQPQLGKYGFKFDGENLNVAEVVNKLGRLEDLEQQLGMDVVTLFGLIGEDFWRIAGGEVHKFTLMAIDNKLIYTKITEELMPVAKIKNLNKTWFLTEKEAQEALERLEE